MKVRTTGRPIDAEQYLEHATNWHALHALVPADDTQEDVVNGNHTLRITYDNRDFYLGFGDWVVRYPDGSLHFFTKATFDELYTNPFTEPLEAEEIDALLGAS